MSFRAVLAVIICKLTRFFLRILKKGGTALPGKIALRVDPRLLQRLSRGVTTVIITGTNGKTTSARIIERAFEISGLDYFANRSGANLLTGITTEFAVNSTISGKPKCRYAVIECDEAASKKVCEYLSPAVILVTNVFRDQLDRFSEVSTTLDGIATGIKNAPGATLCLNADCSLSVSLADGIPNKIIYYGLDADIDSPLVSEHSDAARCIKCGTPYEYKSKTYAHLGDFHCPECGFSRPAPDVAVTGIPQRDLDTSLVEISVGDHTVEACVNLPGTYNIYNAAGALCALTTLGVDLNAALEALETFTCGFGRMEKFSLGSTELRMILVKNPAGCSQVVNYLGDLGSKTAFAVCLNDRIADGTDVSWIWDVDFEALLGIRDRLTRIYVAGERRFDMALRLKYAGFSEDEVRIAQDYGELISLLEGQDAQVVVMPTYTAMLELRGKLVSLYGGQDFWE